MDKMESHLIQFTVEYVKFQQCRMLNMTHIKHGNEHGFGENENQCIQRFELFIEFFFIEINCDEIHSCSSFLNISSLLFTVPKAERIVYYYYYVEHKTCQRPGAYTINYYQTVPRNHTTFLKF